MPTNRSPFSLRTLRAIVTCAAFAFTCSAFAEDTKPPATTMPDAKPEAVKAPATTAAVVAKETRTLWQLKGGGEIFGNLIKETPGGCVRRCRPGSHPSADFEY
jgi:hypothetical protein